jgi:signal transduction histidine kinase
MIFDFKKNISFKINAFMIFIVVILFLVIGIIEFQTNQKENANKLENDYEIVSDRLIETLRNPIWDLDIDTMNSILTAEMQNENIQLIAVTDYQTDKFLAGKARDVNWELVDLSSMGSTSTEKKIDVLKNGDPIAFIELQLTDKFYKAEINAQVRGLIIQTIILIIVFSSVLYFIILFIVVKPIKKLAGVTQEISKEGLDKKVEVKSQDEVGQLGEAFNVMTSKLKGSYAGLEKKVKDRTVELEKERSIAVKGEKEMAGIRTATLSILEDVDETRKELAKSNKLKDLFMDIMRHDLLNPAGVVRMNSQLALEAEKDAEKKKLLEPIERQSNRMIRMIENASILAKLESGEKIEFKEEDLGVMLKGSVEELGERVKEKGMIVKVFAEGKFPAVVNPLIQNVFSNFLSNAIKYSPEKTEVLVGIKEKGSDWLVYVEDRGEGIPAEYKKAVFDRFTRLEKGAIKGSGLGLAISKKITEAHNGKIWVRDHKGGGSVFYVLVPKVHGEVVKPVAKVVPDSLSEKKVVNRLIKGTKEIVRPVVKEVVEKTVVKPAKKVATKIVRRGLDENG